MSLVTSCPACATSFYVKPQQLTLHRGDVRCGKCSHVFNAQQRLVEVPDSVNVRVMVEDSIMAVPASSNPTQAPSIATYSQHEHSPKQFSDVASKAKLHPVVARNTRVWHLYTFSLLLLLALAIQSTYYLRTRISILWPQTKPYLVYACDIAGCTVPLSSDINLLKVDDSDLQEDRDYAGLYHLNIVLLNEAAFAQDLPLLELTLTDSNDKSVLRRAFKPKEYLPDQTDFTEGIAPGAEVTIKLDITTSDIAVSGYRISPERYSRI